MEGAIAQYPRNIKLSDLAAGEGFQINGAAAHYAGGFPATAAGDINGDGFADLIVGSHPASPNGLVNAGAAYALFGSATGFASPLTLGLGPGVFRMNGEAAYDFLGVALDSAGDFNGDGFADLLLGAPGATPHGSFSGAGYVVFGSASEPGSELNLTTLDGQNGFKMNGERNGDRAARAVATAGDVNGDGFADIILGAYRGDANGVRQSGVSYVVFGSASAASAVLELSALTGTNGFKIDGAAGGDLSGFSVASAGDVNGDGFADVIIGAYLADPLGRDASGASYVVFGKAAGFGAELGLAALDGLSGFKIDGENAGDHSGFSVAAAGDVNGDGLGDIIIGAIAASPLGRLAAGASYVVFGKSTPFDPELDLATLDGSNGFRISGEIAGDNSGSAVARAGDVNGDGFDDVIIGAYFADPNGANTGASFVVFGKASSFAPDLDLATLDGSNGFKISGSLIGGRSGRSVATAGDLNDDGLADLIISAPFADPNGSNSGAANVVYGRMPDAAVTRVGSDASQTIIGGSFDDQLVGLGGGDTLRGAAGNDILDGGTGDDRVAGGAGDDTLIGGADSDTLDYSGFAGTVSVNMARTAPQNTKAAGIDRQSGFENILGGSSNDIFAGSASANLMAGMGGADRLKGQAGDDRLEGGDGNDILQGGDGNDILVGGAERDVLTGDAGNDIFGYLAFSDCVAGRQRDQILDFAQGADLIDLSAIDAVSGGGNDSFAFIGGAAFNHSAGQLRFFQRVASNQTFIEGDIDGNGAPDIQIMLRGLFTMNSGDFAL